MIGNSFPIKVLTLALVCFVSYVANAKLVQPEKFKTHYRMSLYLAKDKLLVTQKGGQVVLETLDLKTYEDLVNSLRANAPDSQVFQNWTASSEAFPQQPAKISLKLKNSKTEVFNFYQLSEGRLVLDFWNYKTKEEAIPQKTIVKKAPAKAIPAKTKKIEKAKSRKSVKNQQAIILNKGYRDFRYGAALVWNYTPLIPKLEKSVNLERKTPELFYPIKDFDIQKSEKNAHMQLTINLFRRKKLGLMNKSIRLYQQKYGEDQNSELNQYIKVNSIFRKNLKDKNQSEIKAALNLLSSLATETKNERMRHGIYQYLIQYYLDSESYIEALRLSRNFYFDAVENYETELAQYAGEVILHSLARLGQDDQIKEYYENPKFKKIVPFQKIWAYQLFSLVKKNNYEEAIRLYGKKKDKLTKPIMPSISYNMGEAYFRASNFSNAIQHFDEFIYDYSYISESSLARLRIALSYELMGKDIDKIAALYKNALNRSILVEARLESKLRYVALLTTRKINPTKDDWEKLVFLNNTDQEKKSLDGDLKKLTWLVRLRTLINQKKYREAYQYLKVIPIDRFKPVERRLFEGDGAEIVYGLVHDYYNQKQYSELIRVWEVNKNRFSKKVAFDPQVNFLVAKSYLKLSFHDNFQKSLVSFSSLKKAPVKTFPVWVERQYKNDPSMMVKELKVIKNIKVEKYLEAEKIAKTLGSKEFPRRKFYLGLIDFNQKKYDSAIKSFEEFMVDDYKSGVLELENLVSFFESYSKALYEKNNFDRFKTVSKAMEQDLEGLKENPLVSRSLEHNSYLILEVLSQEAKPESFLSLEGKANNFLQRYEDSNYRYRVTYLMGLAKLKNKKSNEAKTIFEDLLNKNETPDHIKELSKSELASLRIQEQAI